MLKENYVTFAPAERSAVAKIEHVPWPDHKSRRYHYLPADKTPTNNRVVNEDPIMQKKIVKASAKAKKKYEDYDWNAMFNDGCFTKQTVAVLDKYQRHHKLHSASNKKAIVSAVQRHITHQFNATSQQLKEKSDSDSRDESEIVAH
ncbi:hypothetical protein NEMVEDRAFT_v1g220488 [Paramuricea clavata]|uniref:Uncharacterized protein n=1 Tax=Paramuricea clavata TaxID=317549 RepID=A0A7D9EVN1_PARCT|nr:hypothetical protein NEMVEDRAFT_v1g220488 [Paramuricea clavata]